MIKVAFRYGDTRLFSRFICWVRGGDVSHCEVIHHTVADVHACVSSSWVDGGVREKIMPLPAHKWRIYEVVGDPLRVRAWLEQHDQEVYGWRKLLVFVTGLRLRGGPTCSSATADMLGMDADELFCPRLIEAVCIQHGTRLQ